MARKTVYTTVDQLREKIIECIRKEIASDNHTNRFEEDDSNNKKNNINRVASGEFTFEEDHWLRHTDFGDLARKDCEKVEFDTENSSSSAKDHPELKDILGFHELAHGLSVYGILEGGDWEVPIIVVIYWDGKNLRGYVPKNGNPWNYKTKAAFGNNQGENDKYGNRSEGLDNIEFKKRFGISYDDFLDDEDQIEVMNVPDIIKEIIGRFEVVGDYDTSVVVEETPQKETVIRYAAKISTKELAAKLKEQEHNEPSRQIFQDVSRINFDWENTTDVFDIPKQYVKAYESHRNIYGVQDLGNDLVVHFFHCQGDWELASVVVAIYWDGEQLRGYVPLEGNAYNRDNMSAFGNDDEDLDEKVLLRDYGIKISDECPYIDYDDALKLYDIDALLEDVRANIVVKYDEDVVEATFPEDDSMTPDEILGTIVHIEDLLAKIKKSLINIAP